MRVLLFFVAALTAAVAARAQTPPTPPPAAPGQAAQTAAAPPQASQTVCGQPVPAPRTLPPPPAGSGPVVYQVVPCFEKQGGFPVIEANTYLYYMEMTSSVYRPATAPDRWVAYGERIERIAEAR